VEVKLNPVPRSAVDAAIAKVGRQTSLVTRAGLEEVLNALGVDGADRL
jgi:hypothetical protein